MVVMNTNYLIWLRKLLLVVVAFSVGLSVAISVHAQSLREAVGSKSTSELVTNPPSMTDTLVPAVPLVPIYEPLWFNAENEIQPWATQAVQMLLDAEKEGLQPQDYKALMWQQKLQAISQEPLSKLAIHAIDKEFTQVVVLYLNHLHQGRIDPTTIGEKYELEAHRYFDAEGVLRQAIASGNVQLAQHIAMPQAPMYAQLRQQLQLYLKLRQHAAWQEPLPALSKKRIIKKGQKWVGLPVVIERLVAMGDMEQIIPLAQTPEPLELTFPVDETTVSDAADAIVEQALPQAPPLPVFDDALQAGIAAFQKRHRLRADGRLNYATVKKLNRNPEQIAQHIAQTMERLRWVFLRQTERMIVVNIPEYRLRAYRFQNGEIQHVLPMDVIVGKTGRNKTPLFSKDMVRIEFSPYWNVPISILRREMLSRISSDPSYIRRNNYEVVGVGGTTREITPEVLDALRTGRARVRQRPGRSNAMGGIKFIFPNRNNIYLHYTASPRLFKRNYRALSHGCIRVHDPVALAYFILQDEPDWSKERIKKMMGRGRLRVVQLDQPLSVVLTYLTAFIHESGKLYFVPDVYGQDRRLHNALATRKM